MGGPECCDRVGVGVGCCEWMYQSVMIGWVLWVGGPECCDRVGVGGGCCGWVYQSVMIG